jgi:hypothetical protein
VADDTYYASVRESIVGANKRHLSVFNDVGSGKIMMVYRIKAAGTPTAAVSGLIVALGALRITTVPTDGTAMGFAKARAANPDVPAQVTARFGATTGTVEPIAFGLGAVSGEETQASSDVIYEAPIDGSQTVEFVEGTGFEVRQLTLASAGAISIIAVIGLKAA